MVPLLLECGDEGHSHDRASLGCRKEWDDIERVQQASQMVVHLFLCNVCWHWRAQRVKTKKWLFGGTLVRRREWKRNFWNGIEEVGQLWIEACAMGIVDRFYKGRHRF